MPTLEAPTLEEMERASHDEAVQEAEAEAVPGPSGIQATPSSQQGSQGRQAKRSRTTPTTSLGIGDIKDALDKSHELLKTLVNQVAAFPPTDSKREPFATYCYKAILKLPAATYNQVQADIFQKLQQALAEDEEQPRDITGPQYTPSIPRTGWTYNPGYQQYPGQFPQQQVPMFPQFSEPPAVTRHFGHFPQQQSQQQAGQPSQQRVGQSFQPQAGPSGIQPLQKSLSRQASSAGSPSSPSARPAIQKLVIQRSSTPRKEHSSPVRFSPRLQKRSQEGEDSQDSPVSSVLGTAHNTLDANLSGLTEYIPDPGDFSLGAALRASDFLQTSGQSQTSQTSLTSLHTPKRKKSH